MAYEDAPLRANEVRFTFEAGSDAVVTDKVRAALETLASEISGNDVEAFAMLARSTALADCPNKDTGGNVCAVNFALTSLR